MQTRKNNRTRCGAWMISAGVLAMLSGNALAHEPGEGREVLRGPRVHQTGGPDRAGDEMTGEQRRAGGERAQRQEPRLVGVLLAVRSLQRADDESLRLTEAQQGKIKEIAQAQRAEMEIFMEAHKDEIHELRERAGLPERERAERGERERRGPEGRRPVAENEMDAPPRERARRGPSDDATEGNRARRNAPRDEITPEQQDARAELKALMETAPDDAEAVKSIMGVLTEGQRAMVEKKIAQGRERMRSGERRRGEGVERGERLQRRDRQPADD